MKKSLLCLCLLFGTVVLHAQTPLRAAAVPSLGYGAPYFVRPDSTGAASGIIAPGTICFVESQTGPWLKINYNGKFGYYALAHTLRVANKLGGDIEHTFAGANAVIIHVAATPEEAFTNISKFLLAEGYTFAQRDKELLFLTCNPQAAVAITTALSAAVSPETGGAQVLLTGQFSNAGLEVWIRNGGTTRFRIADGGGSGKSSPWGRLTQLAARYPGGRIGYIQQP